MHSFWAVHVMQGGHWLDCNLTRLSTLRWAIPMLQLTSQSISPRGAAARSHFSAITHLANFCTRVVRINGPKSKSWSLWCGVFCGAEPPLRLDPFALGYVTDTNSRSGSETARICTFLSTSILEFQDYELGTFKKWRLKYVLKVSHDFQDPADRSCCQTLVPFTFMLDRVALQLSSKPNHPHFTYTWQWN